MERSLRALSVATAAGVATVAYASPGDRATVRLNSNWQSVLAPHGAEVPQDGWRPAAVPGFQDLSPRGGSRDLWYRRPLSIPSGWTGRRIFLDLRGARYAPCVYLDGKLVKERFDGWYPLEVELTPYVKPGQTHSLVVRCQDWGATFPEGFTWPADRGDDAIRGKVLGPIGGYKNHFGLVFPVLLHSRPTQRLVEDDLQIVTSVRRGELSLAGRVEAEGGQVQAEVWDGAHRVLVLPPARVDEKGGWRTRAMFPRPRYWSPEDPHRYELRLTLRRKKGGAPLDRLAKRFGFRELWAEGPDFVLNGVKRHLLASSTWPVTTWYDLATVKRRVAAAKAGGIDTFRLHIGPWQEEFFEAADEIGLMLIDESAVYTDSGSYGYHDPLFWERYREHLAGMVRRGRNHPSVVMWSLGNEILFMGNERIDPDLSKKLGALALYVRSLDPTRLLTFEADIDPAGAYDVIGLHYPHELPNQYAYPEVADWLGERKLTEAAGGMLGQRRTGFRWDRRKPLYIGEYLWVPQGDYSPGSVYFGDEAYRNRERMNDLAKTRSWIDQTIAYRRSGVSGLCPWTAMDFGMVPGPKSAMDAQRVYFKRQAAFLRDRGLRFFSGERATLRFDVFNDVATSANLQLSLWRNGRPLSTKRAALAPADYAELKLDYAAPVVRSHTTEKLAYRLTSNGREVDRGELSVSISPRASALSGVVVYDPSGKWPGSVRTFPARASVLVIAPGALGGVASTSNTPLVGASSFDGAEFRRYLTAGGRAVVLEQSTLAPLGLGVSLVEHPSTMTFPVDPSHPVLDGLSGDDLKHWRGDGYVSRYELRRTGSHGFRAIAVSGGPDSLAQTPIAEMSVGRGHVVFLQGRVGEKRATDPAAQRLLGNAVAYLKRRQHPLPRLGPVLGVGLSGEFLAQLRAMGMNPSPVSQPLSQVDVERASGLILQGGGIQVLASTPGIGRALQLGIPVYWHLPTPEVFGQLRHVLGRTDLEAVADPAGTVLRLRDHPLLRGVSREDLVFTTPPQSWNRITSPTARAAEIRFLPDRPEAKPERIPLSQVKAERGRLSRVEGTPAFFFPWKGSLAFDVESETAGFRTLVVDAKGTPGDGEAPVVGVQVDGDAVGWFEIPTDWAKRSLAVPVPAGRHRITLAFQNLGDWGGPRTVHVRGIEVGAPNAYPEDVDVLTSPATTLTWRYGKGTVVVDGIAWERDRADHERGRRFLSALLANLGFPFADRPEEIGDVLPTSGFATTGGRYNTADAARIELRSNGAAEEEFQCGTSGEYILSLLGSSTPAEGEFARVSVLVDDVPWGEITLSATDTRHTLGPRRLTAGRHRLRLVFANDASTATEDRNLTIRQVAFRRAESKTP